MSLLGWLPWDRQWAVPSLSPQEVQISYTGFFFHSLCPLPSAQDEMNKVRTDTKLNFNLEKSRVKELVCSFIQSQSLISS